MVRYEPEYQSDPTNLKHPEFCHGLIHSPGVRFLDSFGWGFHALAAHTEERWAYMFSSALCAGLDVHKDTVVACVLSHGRKGKGRHPCSRPSRRQPRN